jgi:hypothetical protein
VAGRQGFELGAKRFSKLVMARDFWFKRFDHRRLRCSVSFTAVHHSPLASPPVVGDILETKSVNPAVVFSRR